MYCFKYSCVRFHNSPFKEDICRGNARESYSMFEEGQNRKPSDPY